MLNSCGNGIKVLSLTIYKKGKCFPQIKKSKIMKKAMMFVAIALMGLTSCKKEEIKLVETTQTSTCDCGVVTAKSENGTSNTDEPEKIYFMYTLKNNCSGKSDKFELTISNQNGYEIGQEVCVDKEW